MDGIGEDGGKQFVKDLGLLREKANSYGIPAGISEEWDRPGDMVRMQYVMFFQSCYIFYCSTRNLYMKALSVLFIHRMTLRDWKPPT